MALFAKRPLAPSAKPADWATRFLPAPTIQVAYAAVTDCVSFSATWASRAEALGIDPTGPLSVLGDGAEWIWRATTTHFPGAAQVLDIFHSMHYVASAGTALYGEATAAAKTWTETGRQALLADGWPGLLHHVGRTTAEPTAAGQASLDQLLSYFAKHTDRLGDFGRLHMGRSIGGGGVESLARRLGDCLKVAGRG